MIEPCCGFPLRNGAIILAVVDILGSIFGAVSSALTLAGHTLQNEGGSSSNPMTTEDISSLIATHRSQGVTRLLNESTHPIHSMVGFVMMTCLVELFLGVILLKGARRRDAAYCNVWWRTKLVIFLASLAVILFAFVVSEDRLEFAVGGIFGIIYQVYGLWVVKAFILEMEFPAECEQKGIQKL